MLTLSNSVLAKNMSFSLADKSILTIGEVTDYLKVTERIVCRLAEAKQIHAFKVGGGWRFSKIDIYLWIRQQSTIFQSATGISQD